MSRGVVKKVTAKAENSEASGIILMSKQFALAESAPSSESQHPVLPVN